VAVDVILDLKQRRNIATGIALNPPRILVKNLRQVVKWYGTYGSLKISVADPDPGGSVVESPNWIQHVHLSYKNHFLTKFFMIFTLFLKIP